MSDKPKQIFDTPEAAEFLGMKATTLENWRSTRRVELPFIKIGRSVRYRLADLEAFIEAQTRRGHGDN